MKFLWSIMLLASLAFAAAGPLFFGHAIVAKDSKWYLAAGICLLIAAALFFVQKQFQADEPVQH